MPWQFWSPISLNCENNLHLRSFPNEKQVVALPNCTAQRTVDRKILEETAPHRTQKFFSLVKERGNSLFEND